MTHFLKLPIESLRRIWIRNQHPQCHYYQRVPYVPNVPIGLHLEAYTVKLWEEKKKAMLEPPPF